MHPNPIFRKNTANNNLEFARQRGFGSLSINGDELPLTSHIPFVFDEKMTHLQCHLVKSNPIYKQIAKAPCRAVLNIMGQDAYISPDWYELENQVPTWNYIAVRLEGELSILDESILHNHLELLSDHFENELLPKKPWKLSKVDQAVYAKLARMIAPAQFTITHVDGTWKLSQNKSETVRQNAARALQNIAVHNKGKNDNSLSDLMMNLPASLE